MAFLIYYGHVNSDNHDRYPTHRMEARNTVKEVLELHKEFNECDHSDCSDVHFRVFKGTELRVVPKERVTEYELTTMEAGQAPVDWDNDRGKVRQGYD